MLNNRVVSLRSKLQKKSKTQFKYIEYQKEITRALSLRSKPSKIKFGQQIKAVRFRKRYLMMLYVNLKFYVHPHFVTQFFHLVNNCLL